MIIFQHFNNTFNDIAEIVVPHNREYCKKYNYTYKDYYGSFDQYYKSVTYGAYKEYWTKLLILAQLLDSNEDEWILMLDGDILLDKNNDIGIISKMMPKTKYIAVCRASSDITQFWDINIGSLLVRTSVVSKLVIKGLLILGEDSDFNYYEQPALQKALHEEELIRQAIEVFPPLTFNGIDGPFLFHPCGKGFTTTEKDKDSAISNKLLALKQKLSGSL